MNTLDLILESLSPMNIFFIVTCLVLCMYYHYASHKNKLKGQIDNGAQYATTTGVFFTFIGITIALVTFDTNDIEGSIVGFISGMKVAFITSLIGIFFAYFIRKMQDTIEIESTDAISSCVRKTADNSDITVSQLKLLVERQDNGTNEMLLSAITKLEESVRYSNSGQLGVEIKNLSDSLKEYIETSKSSGEALKAISLQMNNQSAAIKDLAAKIESSNNALATELSDSNKEQIERLDRMNSTISDMKDYSNKMYENSNKALEESRGFQTESLKYSTGQLETLRDNTQQITDMKFAFNKFLDDMAKKNNEEFIKALNESMKDLNQQLTEQFGDNFKELNHAVGALLDWQKEYRQIIEETTTELHSINAVFSQFSTDIQPQIIKMSSSIQTFQETSEKNIDVQNELLNMTNHLHGAIENVIKLYDAFDEFTYKLAAKTTDSMEKFSDSVINYMEENHNTIRKETEALTENISKLKEVSVNVSLTTENSLNQFSKSSDNVMKSVGDTLERFDVDFKEEIANSMSKLAANLQTISENTNKQGDIAVKTLAAALGKITERMTGNYVALVDRIEKIDNMLSNH